MGRTEQRLDAERTGAASTLAAWRWTSDAIPPRERVSQWHDVHAKAIARRTIITKAEEFGRVEVDLMRLGGAIHQVGLQRMRIEDPSEARRDISLLQDGNDDVILHLQFHGTRSVEQLGREATVLPGGAAFSINGEASTIRLTKAADFVSIALPRAALCAQVPDIEASAANGISRGQPGLRLLTSYLGGIDTATLSADPRLGALAAGQIIDLAAHIALGVLPEEAEGACGGLAAARLAAIKAEIGSNLTGDLSVGTLARRNGMSTRYLHKLFERQGTTLSRYVLGLRLERLRRSLVDPRNRRRTIAELIYAAGFNDVSSCNRAFKARFDATPGDVRNADG